MQETAIAATEMKQGIKLAAVGASTVNHPRPADMLLQCSW
jgi:hypothetical protein